MPLEQHFFPITTLQLLPLLRLFISCPQKQQQTPVDVLLRSFLSRSTEAAAPTKEEEEEVFEQHDRTYDIGGGSFVSA